MKIAVLHWHSSSVGGINTRLQNYRRVADARGDTFHVFACDAQRTKQPRVLPSRLRVRGGDSFIVIDGYAPHHESNYRDTLRMLSGYDFVMLSFLCPHPTKAYGDQPRFLPLLKGVAAQQPLIGYVSDAYWDTYREFAELVLPLCRKTLVAQKAYGTPLVKAGYPVQPVYLPFSPFVEDRKLKGIKRDLKRVAWTPQWKNIKGIHGFYRALPDLLRAGYAVDLYNNGIEYYKLRLDRAAWDARINKDFFSPEHNGKNRKGANFFGCLELPAIATALTSSGFMVDFQGHRAKYAAYLDGSYNNTIVEALYYGAVPVVHENMLKSPIAKELLPVTVKEIADYPLAIANYNSKDYPRKRAREFVLDTHSAERLYEKIFGRK